jgi:hypothetical protein
MMRKKFRVRRGMFIAFARVRPVFRVFFFGKGTEKSQEISIDRRGEKW